MTYKLKSREFIATVNVLNQVTVSKEIREKFSVDKDDQIVLEFKGKVRNELVKPGEIINKSKNDILI